MEKKFFILRLSTKQEKSHGNVNNSVISTVKKQNHLQHN